MCILILLSTILGAAVDGTTHELLNFTAESMPAYMQLNNVRLSRIKEGRRADFEVVDWPNINFVAPEEGWDWHAYAGIAVTLYNPGDASVNVSIRLDNDGADGMNHCNTVSGGVPPKETYTLQLRFNSGDRTPFWGMRGVPLTGPLGTGPKLDLEKITAFQIFLPRPQKAHSLILKRAWLFGKGSGTEAGVPFPFVDRFGQYMHADWLGKLHSEAELADRVAQEEKRLLQSGLLPCDTYGGWLEGPQLEATGWFRTEKVKDKWWLVTPEGHLFFSLGIDCVGMGGETFVEKREDWFEWLPPVADDPYSIFYGKKSHAHSMAEAINGQGRTFNFYRANLYRKYGPDWAKAWRETTCKRLSAWGFNTVANWSQHDVYQHGTHPFALSTNIGDVPLVQGATGYWAKMKDVYAPEFAPQTDAALARLKDLCAKNPRCIGYFVDNELAWEGVARGVLNSPVDQPCRKVFVKELQARYETLAQLNKAWEVDAESWDALKTPKKLNEVAKADLDRFLYQFARRYFETVQAAGRKHMPNTLYLGCRFAAAPEPAVRACDEVADVNSFNLYYQSVPETKWKKKNVLSKPAIIGEFHFGALDRGMFHTGLSSTANQQERAEAYARYVQSALRHPAVVGCHWFQYVDEPNTGRWFDGENYNIGFVDVTDTPYPEMMQAAQKVHRAAYDLRYGKNVAHP